MNADVKRQWVAALRSGHYAQGMGYEKTVEATGRVTYCALGVLGALWEAATGYEGFVVADATPQGTHYTLDLAHLRLAEWLGSASPWHPMTSDGALLDRVTKANDNGQSFADIADLVEAGAPE